MTKFDCCIVFFIVSFNLTAILADRIQNKTVCGGGCEQAYCYETSLSHNECYHEEEADPCLRKWCINTYVFVARCPGSEADPPCPFVQENNSILFTQYYRLADCSTSNLEGKTAHLPTECEWFYNHATRCETSSCYGPFLPYPNGGPHIGIGTQRKCPPYW